MDFLVVPPGTKVQLGTIPARVEHVRIGTSLKPEYLLSWWDGRCLHSALFDRDEFTTAKNGAVGIGFERAG